MKLKISGLWPNCDNRIKMPGHTISTPCPISHHASGRVLNVPTFADDENTADVAFTAKFPAYNAFAQPRRRPSTLTGHFQENVPAKCSRKPSRSKCVSFGVTLTGNQRAEDQLQPPRRKTPLPASVKLQAKSAGEKRKETKSLRELRYGQDDVSELRKDPRRRTIFIPSDDTTIVTIHPGLRAIDTNTDDTIRDAQRLSMIGDAKASMRQDGAKRRSSLTIGPRRAPLQPSLKPVQESTDRIDRFGASWDKENIPPGSSIPECTKSTDQFALRAKRRSVERPNFRNESQNIPRVFSSQKGSALQDYSDDSCEPWATQPSKGASSRAHPVEVLRSWQPCSSYVKRKNPLYHGRPRNDSQETSSVAIEELSNRSNVSQHPIVDMHKRYKILEENIETPEMFEAAWLSDSELAIQQLLNRIFKRQDGQLEHSDSSSRDTRHELFELYTSSDIVLVYRRLQASLMYGALNPPNGSPFIKSNWASDLGLRCKYKSLLLGTYDSEVLKVAAEVVVGRAQEPCLPLSPTSTLGERSSSSILRNLKTFIEDCLVDNQDAHENLNQRSPLWSWRRTMLRSLMLILLLDKAKENGLISTTLFKPSSRFKTSHEVLLDLLRLLSPFTGHRSLAQLNYKLEYVQPWSMEYAYEVQNLATDMRDGVKLTRLVEILLHAEGQAPGPQSNKAKADIVRNHDNTRWTLSEQLKMPCHCTTQKISNVQIALSALRDRLSTVLDDIRAEDIVHGHREKTITLLWTLLSKFGLDEIIDFRLIESEIRRLTHHRTIVRPAFAQDRVQEEVDFCADADKNVNLLKKWTAAVALYHGERIKNFTTAFSDGRLFNAIVDEYSKYIPGKYAGEGGGQSRPLTAKLKDLGCSNAFGTFSFPHSPHE